VSPLSARADPNWK